MNHPWKEIALSDYENHMSLQTVQQLQALNQAMREQLDRQETASVQEAASMQDVASGQETASVQEAASGQEPLDRQEAASVMILGIAGGNGLEHIDRNRHRKVFAVDINAEYLAEVEKRYPDLDGILECIHLDIAADAEKLPHADLLIANLLVEYIGYDAFRRAVSSVGPDCVSCVIQIDSDEGFVSDSPYLHAFDRLEEVHCEIEEPVLTKSLASINYQCVGRKAYPLPNGKQLLRLDYRKQPADAM